MDCTFINEFNDEEVFVGFMTPPKLGEEIVFGNPDLEYTSDLVPVYVVTNVLNFVWSYGNEEAQCVTIEVALKRQL